MTETHADYRVLDLMAVRAQCDKVFHCYGATIPCEREMNHEGRHLGHIWGEEMGTVMWGEFAQETDEAIPF